MGAGRTSEWRLRKYKDMDRTGGQPEGNEQMLAEKGGRRYTK
jgi:hypothetical protein